MNGPDCQSPLIVFGAGRSGTTLLVRALGAHPAISFHGETAFLTARLWRETVEDRFWFNWERQFRLNPSSATVPLPPISERDNRALERKAGLLIAEHLTKLLDVRSSAKHWGFKELWNGTTDFNFDWGIYDLVYPNAIWLHLVRNPFTFARSVARWNDTPLTDKYLLDALSKWTAVQYKSRERWETGRYFRVRYEDLIDNPELCLRPVLSCLGLEWSVYCDEALKWTHYVSKATEFRTIQTRTMDPRQFGNVIPGFVEQCEDLSYLEPDLIEIQEEQAFPSQSIINLRGK